MRKTAELAAREATADGINWTFAPMVDITRDARWGRAMEGAGEDPYLGSLIAEARVKGFQGGEVFAETGNRGTTYGIVIKGVETVNDNHSTHGGDKRRYV